MSEKTFEAVKQEMAEALKKLRADFPEALYVSVALDMTDYGTVNLTAFRISNNVDSSRGETLEEAIANLPNQETKKRQRIAAIKAELAKLENN